MKKATYLLISLSLFILLGLFSCKEDEEAVFQDGDIVIQDGIIYEYDEPIVHDRYYIEAPIYDYRSPVNAIYHCAYPYDMLNLSNTPILSEEEMLHILNKPSLSSRIIKTDDNLNYYTPAQYINLFYTRGRTGFRSSYNFSMDDATSEVTNTFLNGFWVKGYTSKVKDEITIPSSIEGKLVNGIGYNALNGANIRKINIISNEYAIEEEDCENVGTFLLMKKGQRFKDFIIMPNGLANLDLEEFVLDGRLLLFPLAFNNCNIDKFSVSDLIIPSDSSFNSCNIEKLACFGFDFIYGEWGRDYDDKSKSGYIAFGGNGYINAPFTDTIVNIEITSPDFGGVVKYFDAPYFKDHFTIPIQNIVDSEEIYMEFSIHPAFYHVRTINNKMDCYFNRDEFWQNIKILHLYYLEEYELRGNELYMVEINDHIPCEILVCEIPENVNIIIHDQPIEPKK